MNSALTWSGMLVKALQYCLSALKNHQARNEALIGHKTRVLYTGQISNIPKIKQNIQIGNNCIIAGQVQTISDQGEIKIGDWCYIGRGSRIWSSAGITIGNRVLISHNVEIHDTEGHPLDANMRARQTEAIFTEGHPKKVEGIRTSPIKIGNDVWIGFGATIRKGVTIGDRAVIGARAIVAQDIPPDYILRVPGTSVI